MINMPHQPPPPPHHQPPHQHNSTLHNQSSQFLSNKPATLPDFLLTALSLFLFITAPKHHLSTPRPISITYPSHPANRRLIRLTSTTSTMSQNTNPNPNFSTFPNPQSLSDWLKPRLPSDSFATWGTKPGTKNVHNLWLEIADGETSLLDTTPPVRNLEVVCVRVLGKDNKRFLLESHQELSDGSIRQRNRPLSEKMKAGEDIESAVKRAIIEELGSVFNDSKDVNFDEIVRIVPGSYNRRVEERVSVSYPGLPACYVLHSLDAFVEGLPEDEFVTEEVTEYGDCECDQGVSEGAVAVKKHFWKWVPSDLV